MLFSDAPDHEYRTMSHYKDLREVYAHRMAYHGYGYGLYHPVAAEDLQPPCFGFFDRNGDWNLICRISTELPEPGDSDDYVPLDYMPKRTMDIGIAWQPKTSLDTTEHTFAGTIDTPDNQPAGAEAKVKYSSANKFGAVLLTRKPITLTAYNDERLFLRWLDANKRRLYERYGPQLRKYGSWIVTRTYTCSGASINAWSDSNSATELTARAKAAMLGELGEELDWKDTMSSRDWSQYSAKSAHGIAVFIDGIDMTPLDWRLEGFRQALPSLRGPSSSTSSQPRQRRASLSASPLRRSTSASPRPAPLPALMPPPEEMPESPFIVDSSNDNYVRNEKTSPEPYPLLGQRRRSSATKAPRHRPHSSLQLPDRPLTWYSGEDETLADETTLRDVGLQAPLVRTRSTRSVSPSLNSISSLSKSPSLRREKRSISIGKGSP